jgi:hypothetical protein
MLSPMREINAAGPTIQRRHSWTDAGTSCAIRMRQMIAMNRNSRAVDDVTSVRFAGRTALAGWLAILVSMLLPTEAHASLLSPELEDKAAGILATFVIFVVPVVLIVLFWLVHIMPEKIAHDRHHPQFEAIRTMCLLSLVFGGLLWPLAWLWAYTKPVGYKLAYGTDKSPDYFKEHGLPEPDNAGDDIRRRVAALEGRGVAGRDLDAIRADLALIEARVQGGDTPSEVR